MKATPDQLATLQRLWTHANGHSGQCRTVAKFLLGLYDGPRFPFDLTDFRSLDAAIFQDCLVVLTMDYAPEREVHMQLRMDSAAFEQLAEAWHIRGVVQD